MSACILAGFAKKKKFVGGVYACNGSDLPATQDRGTSQVSGPYETIQTLPATEVTYTIIGKTPCGDDIRRITTRTYSSRSVANQYKSGPNPAIGVPPGTPTFILTDVTPVLTPSTFNVFGYGASSSASLASMEIAIGIDKYPATCSSPSIGGGVTLTLVGFDGTGSARYTITGSDTYHPYAVYLSSVVLILYYLDVHEVWTFDLV